VPGIQLPGPTREQVDVLIQVIEHVLSDPRVIVVNGQGRRVRDALVARSLVEEEPAVPTNANTPVADNDLDEGDWDEEEASVVSLF
jgi:hypothetical protein